MKILNEKQIHVGYLKIGCLYWAHNKQEGNFLQQRNGTSRQLAKSISNTQGIFAFDYCYSTFTCVLVNTAKLLHVLGERKKTLQWSAECNVYFKGLEIFQYYLLSGLTYQCSKCVVKKCQHLYFCSYEVTRTEEALENTIPEWNFFQICYMYGVVQSPSGRAGKLVPGGAGIQQELEETFA